MNPYSTTISEIYDLQEYAIKLGLDNIRFLSEMLGQPHKAFPVIHVAGTNGKGSTSFFIAQILQAMGLKVGLYTSPHLVDYRERISMNGALIKENFIVSFWQGMRERILDCKATFFDTTTALAFSYFASQKIDAAVIETGLGGRLDSTNIVEPELVVLTPIDFDHEKQLGSHIMQIAAEKAAIIKNDAKVFSAKQQPDVLKVIRQNLQQENQFYYLPEQINCQVTAANLDVLQFNLDDRLNRTQFKRLRCRQIGNFQAENIALSYLVSREFLKPRKISFDEKKMRRALTVAFWKGRLQLVQRNPDIIFDVSHNPHGISNTLTFLNSVIDREQLRILIGLVNDKNYQLIAREIARRTKAVIVTEPDSPRRLDGSLLTRELANLSTPVVHIKDALKAFEYAKSTLTEKETLLVIGSHYLIGALIKALN